MLVISGGLPLIGRHDFRERLIACSMVEVRRIRAMTGLE
jgi:hypothetical protein